MAEFLSTIKGKFLYYKLIHCFFHITSLKVRFSHPLGLTVSLVAVTGGSTPLAIYLQWVISGYVTDAISDYGQTGDEQAENNDNKLEEPEHFAMTTSDLSLIGGQLGATSHLVAKHPALTGMSVTSLVNNFRVVDLLQHLNESICFFPLVTASGSLPVMTSSTFSLYK